MFRWKFWKPRYKRIYHWIKEVGIKHPDYYRVTMGLGMGAWDAETIIEYLKRIPKDATLKDIKWREQFQEVTLIFQHPFIKE